MASIWNSNYIEYETAEQKRRKFFRRLKALDLTSMLNNDEIIADLFCGSGENSIALNQLGFANVINIDLAFDLLKVSDIKGRSVVGNALSIPLSDASVHAVCVQGGFHHLHGNAECQRVLSEVWRVLKPGGHLIYVEPHMSICLKLFITIVFSPLASISKKARAIRAMIEIEGETYKNWLANYSLFECQLKEMFVLNKKYVSWHNVACIARKASS